MDSVIQRLVEIYNGKISKGLSLTEDEKELITKHADVLKDTKDVDEELKRNFYVYCAFSKELNIRTPTRVYSLVWAGDDDAIIKFLERPLTLPPLAILSSAIKNKDLRKNVVSKLSDQVQMYVNDHYVHYFGTEEEMKAWDDKVVEIKDVTELDLVKLKRLPDDVMIRISR